MIIEFWFEVMFYYNVVLGVIMVKQRETKGEKLFRKILTTIELFIRIVDYI